MTLIKYHIFDNCIMDIITGVMITGLVLSFVGTVFKNRLEFCILSLIFTFASFVAVTKDVEIPADLVMLFYVPIVAMGLFTVSAFFKVKV